MARIRNPWRAMALASVFTLAACGPLSDTATPSVTDASAQTSNPVQVDLLDKTAVTAAVANGLESLVVIQDADDNGGVLGAGCTLDSEEPLPDGDWFGFVLDATKHKLVVDIACVYGPGSDQFEVYAAAEESAGASYVVINDVPEELELRFGSGAQAYMAADNWEPRAVRDVVEEAQPSQKPGTRGVWLRVENGRLNAVVQPYSMGVAAG